MAPRGNSRRLGRDLKSDLNHRSRKKASPSGRQNEVLNPYDALLLEASASTDTAAEERPFKRRRVAPDALRGDEEQQSDADISDPKAQESSQMPVQVVYNDDSSSDASDMDWEEVELDDEGSMPAERSDKVAPEKDSALIKDITVNLDDQNQATRKTTASRRISSSAVEKRKRLDAHKIHLCCLLSHVSIRNAWCNDQEVKKYIRSLLSDKIMAFLNPDSSWNQLRRSNSFMEGLDQACAGFRIAYTICERGLKKSNWFAEPIDLDDPNLKADSEELLNLQAFRKAAHDRQGSRDLGAQLFCALLRAVGMDARLVCSLQPLPFAGSPTAPSVVNMNEGKETYYLNESGGLESQNETSDAEADQNSQDDGTGDEYVSHGLQPVKRFGTHGRNVVDYGQAPVLPASAKRKKIIESKYPVFWVEAFNAAVQKWIAVDPLVTRTVAKPHKLEPPASDTSNNMNYVVAFEDDGTAKDVTLRYAKAFNAKTRRNRVEATKGGRRWWKRALKPFSRFYQADRDQVEDADLAMKEAAEPMPRNIQDFKGHPYYALERHLRRNEIIHPKKEVGKLSGSKASDTVESIYRRQDVQIVQSADKWYRTGREIMAGQQPLKYGTASNRRQFRSPSPSSDHDHNQEEGLGLYAKFQTQPFVPPPVVDSKLTKNAYGNLDIYVDSMIPAGAVHVQAMEASAAAKIMGIDYADAVTGFKFKGRRGTAITNGVVVVKEFADAMKEVIRGLRWRALQEEAAKESRVALTLWKRFLVALRIRERIAQYDDDGSKAEEGDDAHSINEQVDDEIQRDEEMQQEGGFIPDKDTQIAQPTARRTTYSTNFQNSAATRDVEAALNRPFNDTVIIVSSPWDMNMNRETTASKRGPGDSTGNIAAPYTSTDLEGGFMKPNEQEVDPSAAQGGDTHDDLFESTSETDQRGGFIPPMNGVEHAEPGEYKSTEVEKARDKLAEQTLDASEPETVRDPGLTTERMDENEQMEDTHADKHSLAMEQNGDSNADEGNDSAEDGSLISHDPDDEETEPQWLADEASL